MAVARDQIKEIKDIIRAYVEPKELQYMIMMLRGTQAYKTNQSFKETIELLAQDL